MRRETIIRASETILRDLNDSGIRAAVDQVVGDRGGNKQKPSLASFQNYSIRTASHGDAEREIIDIFDLKALGEPDFWLSVITEEGPTPSFYQVHSAVYRVFSFLPSVIKLLKQQRLEAVRTSDPKAPDFLRGKALLTVILPETEEQYSSPARLSFALDAIAGLYHVFATLNDLSDSDLSVISCDSGSDKSFDFTGMPQVIQGIRETIVAIWDRIVLHRHQQLRASIETIAQSLPVIERISHMESSGAIAPEQAEILRRKTVQACTKFLDAGAITIDLEVASDLSPRALMGPEQKLLAAPPTPLHEEAEVASKGSVGEVNGTVARTDEAALLKMIEELQRQVDEQKAQTARSAKRPRSKTKGASTASKG
jgi:hypothetical protein